KVWKTGRLVIITLFKQTRQEEGGKLSVCPCLKSHYQEVGRRTREVGEGGQEGGRWRVMDESHIECVCVCVFGVFTVERLCHNCVFVWMCVFMLIDCVKMCVCVFKDEDEWGVCVCV